MVSEGVPISDSASVLVTRGSAGFDFASLLSIALVIILVLVFVWFIKRKR